MKITNKLNLPQAFVKAVNKERHNKQGSYSATTLNKGVKEIILQERHWEEFETDVADNVWAIWGTAVHELFEKISDDNFHEEKFEVPISKSLLTGTVDSYDMANGIINDWKTASVWKVQFKDFVDWKNQGLTYAYLLRKNGLEVKKCRFVTLLKDHSKTKAKTDMNYPQSPVFVYEFDVTSKDLEETEKRILCKVQAIENAENLSDDEIAECSPEERWADNEKFAVMKNGRKSAVKLFDNLNEAENYAGELGNSYFVEHRKAISRKCEDYCLCKDFCNFYKTQVQGASK